MDHFFKNSTTHGLNRDDHFWMYGIKKRLKRRQFRNFGRKRNFVTTWFPPTQFDHAFWAIWKRPVPLEHYMFTGVSTKTSNQLYKIIDQNKRFLNDGYKKASEAKRLVSNFFPVFRIFFKKSEFRIFTDKSLKLTKD